MRCHICDSTDKSHMAGYASGRHDIALGGGQHEAMERYRSALNATEQGRPDPDVADQGAWWLGYYHGRRAERLDLVGVLDIAARAGVTSDAIHKWRDRHPDFPPPEATVSDRPVWQWSEVEAWLRATGRL